MGGKCLLEGVKQFFYFQNQDEHPTISSANTRGFDIKEKYYICTMFNGGLLTLFVLSITFQWAFSKTLKKFAITLISVKVYVY